MDKVLTTAELFRLASHSIGKEKPASAYAVAKALGCTQTCAKNWELGNRVMDDVHAEKVASLLGLDLDFVLLGLEAERRNRSGLDRMAAIFERAALATQHHAASIFIGFFAVSALPHLIRGASELCILC